jgi:hypothetical protein
MEPQLCITNAELMQQTVQIFRNIYSDTACSTFVKQETEPLECDAGSYYSYYETDDAGIFSSQYMYYSGVSSYPVPSIGNYLASS